jgi:ectoine hydroxylase
MEHRLTPQEQEQLRSEGYLVRAGVFRGADLEAVRAASEALVAGLVEKDPGTPKIPSGSYLFQVYPDPLTILKWEPEFPDVLQGIEPFAHFDDAMRGFGLDARLVEPMCGLLGVDAVDLFTEKLNLKRARVGGPIVLHQDYPYWVANSEDPGQIATAIVFLDDAHQGNGGLEVVPGSHRGGVRAGGTKRGFGALEMPPDAFPETELRMVEVEAGSAVFFGSLLVHRSLPNRSGGDRRTLLYSYQPAGRVQSHEGLARLLRR